MTSRIFAALVALALAACSPSGTDYVFPPKSVRPPSSVVLSIASTTSQSCPVGEKVTLTVQVTPVASGIDVMFLGGLDSPLGLGNVTTDASGRASRIAIPPHVGTFVVTCRALGVTSSNLVTFTVVGQ